LLSILKPSFLHVWEAFVGQISLTIVPENTIRNLDSCRPVKVPEEIYMH